MESLSMHYSRRSGRDDFVVGAGASLLAHIVMLCLAVYVPKLLPASQSMQLTTTTVNLVSLEELGIGGPTSPTRDGKGKKVQDLKPASNKDESSSAKTPSDKHPSGSHASKAAPVVPVKRLQLDEPHPTKKIEKYASDVPEVPKAPAPSVEDKLDKMIPKPKPKPEPVPKPAAPQPERAKDTAKEAKADTKKPATPQPTASQTAQSGPAQPGSAAKGSDQKDAKASDAKAGGKGSSDTKESKPSVGSGSEGSGNSKGASPAGSGGSDKGSSAASGNGQAGSGQVGLARLVYYRKIIDVIRNAWTLPPGMSTKAGELEAILTLVVRRDGKILEVRVERRSGNPLFDDSVIRAVRKSDPLPPFPEIYSPNQEEIECRFRPEDLAG